MAQGADRLWDNENGASDEMSPVAPGLAVGSALARLGQLRARGGSPQATGPDDADVERSGARERIAAIAAAVSALDGVGATLYELTGAELGAAFSMLQDLGRLLDAADVAVLGEAITRGETGGDPRDWALAHSGSGSAPAEPGAVSALATVALALTEGVRGDPARRVLADAVVGGQVSPAKARVCLAEMDRLRHRLDPAMVPVVWQAYTDLATMDRVVEVRRLRDAVLARYGVADELARDHEQAAGFVTLSAPTRDGALSEYRLVLDPEGRAVLEAAIGPLAAPVPGPDGGLDPRAPAQRRGQALVEIVRRAVAAGGSTPVTTKAQVIVTMSIEDLRAERGAGEILGSAVAGTLVPPGTVRRMCCDGLVLPVVLGAQSQVLDLGRAVRLFTAGQVRALILRDRHCTFPGCDSPGTWADAHHLIHWIDHGESDLDNGALLCGRHHGIVHSRRLHGWVEADGQVRWDLAPGSYDSALAQEHTPAAHRPP